MGNELVSLQVDMFFKEMNEEFSWKNYKIIGRQF